MKATKIVLKMLACVLVCGLSRAGAGATELPDTAPLIWPEADLSERLMDGAHRFVEHQIEASVAKRTAYWKYDFSSPTAYEQSVEPNRRRLRELIGAVDPRLPVRLERFGDDDHPALIAETSTYRVYQVRWPVLDGIDAQGLLVQPIGAPVARVVVVPDADQTPEQLLGLQSGVDAELQFARRLAEHRFELVIPTLVSRQRLATEDAQLKNSDQTHREWIYRQAFHMGRHIIGYEVQQVSAAVDWCVRQPEVGLPVGVAGYGEGGLVAFYAAAVDPHIQATLVSGYFDSRQAVWSEPIYRNVFGLLVQFGEAEIASLIVPRRLIIEYSRGPEVRDQKGEVGTPPLDRIRAELARLETHTLPRPELVHGSAGEPVGPGSVEALQRFAQRLGVDSRLSLSPEIPVDRRRAYSPNIRQVELVKQLESHVQGLVRKSEQVRDRFFLHAILPELASMKWSTEKDLPARDAESFVSGAREFRRKFQREAMGQFDEPLLPPNPRTRQILETDRWVAYDVVLDVHPELFAWGVLLLPKGIEPGQRRPVVVCQHGRQGLPRDTIDGNLPAYNNFAAELADRGFITFAPHNLYRGEDRYRWLNRKANNVQATLFSLILAQHDQILRWLATLPPVDRQRIAFYGLSYGGETAMRVPAVLENYCLSICSGDFNQWTTKVAATDQPFSFMRTIEWEMPYWNLGQTFDYAEMAYLMIPRPFMVERGHLDGVGRDAWVAHEYAKVRWLYTQLGLGDRTEIEFFQGGHSIHGQGTFAFLSRHLKWPMPAETGKSPRQPESQATRVQPAQSAQEPAARTSLANPHVHFTVPEKPYVVLHRAPLTAVVADNREVDDEVLPGHRAGYHGLASLRHEQQPRSPFVPSYAGLNFEHILDGSDQDRKTLFEPRHAPIELRVVDDHTAELYQPATPHYGLESCARYELREHGVVELTFECIPRRATWKHDYLLLFWASYIDRPESLDIHFLGRPADQPETPATWIRGVTPKHGVSATHRGVEDARQFPHVEPFPLELPFGFSKHRYGEPWYFGVCRDMAVVQMFRPRDRVRLSQSPSGGGEGCPAWDFQWTIESPRVGQRYQLVMRMLYSRFPGTPDSARDKDALRKSIEPHFEIP